MKRENKQASVVSTWQQSSTTFISLIVATAYLFQASQLRAEVNARGVEIAFLSEEPSATQIEGTSTELVSADLPEAIPFENDLWLRIRSGYAMPDIDSTFTTKYENWYASRPAYVQRMTARSQRYLYYIVGEVEKRGMPTEIALLPMIESAYNPTAYSRSHASGIWQFVPATGRYFGLQQNWWVDNRRDVTAATDAALTYLQKLHEMFGSWDLALAAYNAGEGTVGRAISRNKRRGLPTDYQSLKLPAETRAYVPKLLAVKNIVNYPEKFGLRLNPVPNQAYFAEIEAPEQIDTKLIAELAGISLEEFNALNPSYNRPVVASKGGEHSLLLPIPATERFQTNLTSYDKPLISWQTYQAKRGERMADIAKKFNMKVSKLRSVNSLPKLEKLHSAQLVLVPAKKSSPSKINVARLTRQKIQNGRGAYRLATHRIKRGDTLGALARKYGTNAKSLMRLNRLKSTRIRAGQVIKVRRI